MNKLLETIFKQTSSITFISGERDAGKTDFACRLGEDLLKRGLISKMGGNIRLYKKDYRYSYICYYDLLENWLQEEGSKIYFLDELGVHLWKMGFMGKKAQLILALCQLIRKYGRKQDTCHMIGLAPSPKLINKLFMTSDLLDCHIKKLTKTHAKVLDRVNKRVYNLRKIPRTTLPFITKDRAVFELEAPKRKRPLRSFSKQKKVMLLYCKYRSLRKVGAIVNLSHEEVRNILDKGVESSGIDLSSVNSVEGVVSPRI